MSTATARRLAFTVAGVTLVVLAVALGQRAAFPQARGSADGLALLPLVVALVVVGGLIATRRPRNLYGWLLLASGLGWIVNGATIDYAALAVSRGLAGARPAAVTAAATGAFAWGAFVSLGLLLYPTGSVPGRRWRWVAWVAGAGVALMTAGLTFAAAAEGAAQVVERFKTGSGVEATGIALVLNELGHIGTFFGMVAGVVSLVVRARGADAVQRLQLKWFAYGAAVVALSILVQFFPQAESFSWLEAVSLTAMPVVIGIAITRWHLYDIDRVVSRTLAYLLLTILLAGIYLAGVTMFTTLTAPVAGESPLAVAAATLAAAAVFGPARRRIQDLVDRRFNRARYDVRQTVERFSAELRSEVDLEDVRGGMLRIVGESLEPRDAMLWVRREVAG